VFVGGLNQLEFKALKAQNAKAPMPITILRGL
jgi:hypothetical protein